MKKMNFFGILSAILLSILFSCEKYYEEIEKEKTIITKGKKSNDKSLSELTVITLNSEEINDTYTNYLFEIILEASHIEHLCTSTLTIKDNSTEDIVYQESFTVITEGFDYRDVVRNNLVSLANGLSDTTSLEAQAILEFSNLTFDFAKDLTNTITEGFYEHEIFQSIFIRVPF